ncbi:MAG: IPT/TIG domain-containing protein, partial [Candidatus Geothermincolia bacterium]
MVTQRSRIGQVIPVILALLMVFVLGAFSPAAATEAPHINSITPAEAHIGDVITYGGDHFGAQGSVTFPGESMTGSARGGSSRSISAQVVSWSNTQIKAKVPDNAWGPGSTVYWADATSTYCFDPMVKPSISSITPASGLVGSTVTIKGGGFGPSSYREYRDLVQFWANGTAESVPVRDYISWTTNQIKFKVPQANPAKYNVWVSK